MKRVANFFGPRGSCAQTVPTTTKDFSQDRAARTGRNPQTGEPIEIAAARIPSFKAGKALKDAVN